jgi:hypothetical protein
MHGLQAKDIPPAEYEINSKYQITHNKQITITKIRNNKRFWSFVFEI